MSAPDWQQVFALFEEAVERPPNLRAAFLDDACESPDIRRKVEDLLAADAVEGTVPFGEPVVDRPWRDGGGWVGSEEEDAGLERTSAPLVGIPGTLGAYRILRRIGQGGMSTVYLAVRDDDSFRRRAVVKVVRRGMESEALLRRLCTERQILAVLDHPYIARLYDGGSTDSGLPYFVMEYVEGCFIDEYCETNALTVRERLDLFRKVCSAVHYAHQNLVIHRDIKPSNILVTPEGEPKLLDFGIARLLHPDLTSGEVEPTATRQRLLTPSYASPEQIRGRKVTTACDVYSLGVLLYKLLTGRLPRDLQGLDQSEIERRLEEAQPARPSTVRSLKTSAAGDLDAIVLKALRTAASRRYSSVEQMESDLERHRQGLPVEARAGNWVYVAGKFVRRHRVAVTVLAAVAVLLVGFVAAMGVQSARVAQERDRVRLERNKKQEVLELTLDIFQFSKPYVMPGEELTVREALARSVPVLEAGLRDQPEVRAELLHTSGTILYALREYRTAEHHLETAFEIRQELHGDRHPDVVATLAGLALARKDLGELADAQTLAGRAVDLAKSLDPADEETLMTALNALVSVRCHQSHYAEAAAPAREASALLPRVSSWKLELESLLHRASIAAAEGRYREAEPLYRQALALERKHYGPEHPIQTSTLNNLGVALRRAEDFEASEEAFLQMIELQRANFGEDFRDPLPLANLGGLMVGQERFEEAIVYYTESLKVLGATVGDEHWRVFASTMSVENARIRSGDAAGAEPRIRQLLTLWEPRLGAEHWRLAQTRGVLGESLSMQGKCEEAEVLLTESFDQLLEVTLKRRVEDALERLRRHFERCGEAGKIAPFEVLVAAK